MISNFYNGVISLQVPDVALEPNSYENQVKIQSHGNMLTVFRIYNSGITEQWIT